MNCKLQVKGKLVHVVQIRVSRFVLKVLLNLFILTNILWQPTYLLLESTFPAFMFLSSLKTYQCVSTHAVKFNNCCFAELLMSRACVS